jgi:hypothetical protein
MQGKASFSILPFREISLRQIFRPLYRSASVLYSREIAKREKFAEGDIMMRQTKRLVRALKFNTPMKRRFLLPQGHTSSGLLFLPPLNLTIRAYLHIPHAAGH